MAILRTSRLLLRPARESDLDPLHGILSDPDATAFWSTPPHETLDQTRDWLESMIAIAPHEGEDFIIEHEGQAIGKAGFYRFPEIGFILHPATWGRGFATEALTCVIERGFHQHRLGTIVADVDPRNGASLNLLEKLGFRRTGYREKSWCIAGEWFDSVDLALEQGDWATR